MRLESVVDLELTVNGFIGAGADFHAFIVGAKTVGFGDGFVGVQIIAFGDSFVSVAATAAVLDVFF